MKIGSITISERQQVAAIIVLIVSSLLAIVHFQLIPQARARRANAELRARQARSTYAHMSMLNLLATSEHHQELHRRLWNEWLQSIERLATFPDQKNLRRSEVGRIDYKVELFRVRQRLTSKSRELGVSLLPTDLGMADAVLQDAEARILMLQLKAVEKLADLTLDRRIERLIAIEPMPPVEHSDAADNPSFDEYPVRVEFEIGFENLYALLHGVFEPDSIFIFRRLRVIAGATADAPLRIHAVMSALLFEEPSPPTA